MRKSTKNWSSRDLGELIWPAMWESSEKATPMKGGGLDVSQKKCGGVAGDKS